MRRPPSKNSSAKKRTPVYRKPRFRVMRGKEIALGPGKIDLLEAIRDTGSISSAARKMGLSYRRAWGMVDVMNHCFKEPLVARSTGGKGGGGAGLTTLGERMVSLYRAMEDKAQKASDKEWRAIQKALKPCAGNAR